MDRAKNSPEKMVVTADLSPPATEDGVRLMGGHALRLRGSELAVRERTHSRAAEEFHEALAKVRQLNEAARGTVTVDQLDLPKAAISFLNTEAGQRELATWSLDFAATLRRIELMDARMQSGARFHDDDVRQLSLALDAMLRSFETTIATLIAREAQS